MVAKESTALKKEQAILKWTNSEFFSHIPTMGEIDLAGKIGIAIRTARKQRGFVMRQIADAAGVSTGAVGNWERGANILAMENLEAVARFLRIDPVALSRGELKYLDGEDSLSDAEIIGEAAAHQAGPLDVELLGVAVGGDDGDFTLNGEVQGYVRRPPGVAHLRGVFALHVLSDSMVPRYDPGDLIYCGGRAPVAGDHVVIEMFPEGDEKVGKAYVKKLLRRTKSEIVCEQYNPNFELTFNAYAAKNVWRIIPNRELYGY